MENNQKLKKYNCFASWQETFADAGDGDGEGGGQSIWFGTIWVHHLESF